MSKSEAGQGGKDSKAKKRHSKGMKASTQTVENI